MLYILHIMNILQIFKVTTICYGIGNKNRTKQKAKKQKSKKSKAKQTVSYSSSVAICGSGQFLLQLQFVPHNVLSLFCKCFVYGVYRFWLKTKVWHTCAPRSANLPDPSVPARCLSVGCKFFVEGPCYA